MVNHCENDRIWLRLGNSRPALHFLGYGLVTGKRLILQGDGGDFIGAGLQGGQLLVEGSTGNWCGAGMMKGEISVKRHTGQHTGQWMQAGEIRVDGQIGGLGKLLYGGKIYRQGRPVTGGK